MQNRLVAAAAAIVFVAGAAGCAEENTTTRKTARVTVDGNTRTMDAVSCTQIEWLLTIDATADPAHVKAYLLLESDGPSPETVNIENVDGLYGVSGQGIGNVDAAFANDMYTITGTAQGTNPDDPSNPRTATFRIEAPC